MYFINNYKIQATSRINHKNTNLSEILINSSVLLTSTLFWCLDMLSLVLVSCNLNLMFWIVLNTLTHEILIIIIIIGASN